MATTNGGGAVSRRRGTSNGPAAAAAAAAAKEGVERVGNSSSGRADSSKMPRKDSGRMLSLSSVGKLRLRCIVCLAPAATAAERRRKRSAVGKAVALMLCSAAMLLLGSMNSGSGKGGLLGGLLAPFSLSAWRSYRSSSSSSSGWRILPSSVDFLDGALGYDGPDNRPGRSLSDRDGRLSTLDRSAFGKSYGELLLRRLGPEDGGRKIAGPDPNDNLAHDPLPLHPSLWTDEPYDPYDDDGVRSAVFRLENKETRTCQRAPWHRYHRPTCNDFHAVDVLGGVEGGDIAYLGRGHFRQAFDVKGRSDEEPDTTLKVLRWRTGHDDYVGRIEKTRMDALVMERLTSSPRITNVHGHCATSIVVESLPGEVWDVVVPTERTVRPSDIHDEDGVDNMNGMSPMEKLQLALDTAEALSELHGFKDGVIVHDDIDLGQFLRTPEGKVKLNDFNRAKPMLWDPVEQKYCKYNNGGIGGKMRSPQEFFRPPGNLDESMDVYSLGNNFYGILTGLWPFYLLEDEEAQRQMVKGERPFIDPRWREHSVVEKKLIEVIEKCWIHDPEERADIFWVVKVLREAVAESAALVG
eukprot:CAMPEP_0113579424 /NCGR_PEP_ID=MMETSP0015_2-20120614/30060_1 /TAXON_ID=2838 /ORGANISM="Odontella" /LENGTH=579 /DNA_ID=CAMNT_0000483401 /DNA_START=188 /DNA_END=1927 /DNA_ORIENTATION=+ /assembly_acc=CAM_ASM_000160